MAYLYGINPVLEALRAGSRVRRLYLYRGKRDSTFDKVLALARQQAIEVSFVDKDFFSALPKGHQGIVAEIREQLPCSLDDLYEITSQRPEPAFYLVIDSVEDPHNLGAILRVAEASGVHGVVLPKRRVARGPTVSKSAAGADIHLCMVKVSNIKHAIRDFQQRGIKVIGLEASGEVDLWEVDLSVPLACVVGSEGKGLRRTVLQSCDLLVRIPLFGKVTSLNVSTATAVFAFELRRQRNLK